MTARSPLWDFAALAIATLLIGGVTYGLKLTLAAIGTLDHEGHPLAESRAWAKSRPAAAVAWWHAHRLPLLGLAYPQRGRHLTGDAGEWHPLDEQEAGNGVEGDDRAHQVPARDSGMRELPQPAPGLDAGEMPPARGDDGPHGAVPDRGRDDLPAEDGDLTTDDDYDTGTLALFRDLNDGHPVPPHEPPLEETSKIRGESVPGDLFGTSKASVPGRLPGTTPPVPAAPGTEPPGPDRAGASTTPVTTAPCAAERNAAKGDSPGPGDALTRAIAGHLSASEALLPAWDGVLAVQISRAMDAMRQAVTA